jgi:WD40 repeat protein
MADGGPVATLSGHQGPANSVAFAADGRLFSTGDDGSVRVWDLEARGVRIYNSKTATSDLSVTDEPVVFLYDAQQ